MTNNEKKTALVTGGIGGIGTAICERFVEDGYAVVAATYRGEEERFEKWRDSSGTRRDIHGFCCDVSDWDSCVVLREAVVAKCGAVDVLVNNAGITRDATFKKMTPDMWSAVLNTNLNSIFNVSKQFVPDMMEKGFGRVINISSVNGEKGQFGQTNYSAAKAGIYGFTKALAQEVIRKGVTVNSVSPGYTGTEMVQAMSEEIQQSICATIPARRFATPEEIAHAVSFLASDGAAYVTGANISVNGGLHMS